MKAESDVLEESENSSQLFNDSSVGIIKKKAPHVITNEQAGEKLARIIVASRTGDNVTIESILESFKVSGVSLVSGFDALIENNSSEFLLNGMSSLARKIPKKHLGELVASLLKHSRWGLAVMVAKILNDPENTDSKEPIVNIYVFRHILNNLGTDTLIKSLEYFQERGFNIIAPNRILWTKFVYQGDKDEVKELLDRLLGIGLEIFTRSGEGQTDAALGRAISMDDLDGDFFSILPFSERGLILRKFYESLKSEDLAAILDSFRDALNYGTTWEDAYIDLFEYVTGRHESIQSLHELLVDHYLKTDIFDGDLYFSWAFSLLKHGREDLYVSFLDIIRTNPFSTKNKRKLKIYPGNISFFCDNQSWTKVDSCYLFVRVVKDLTNSEFAFLNLCYEYWCRKTDFAGTLEFVLGYESISGVKQNGPGIFLSLRNALDRVDLPAVYSLMEFGQSRNVLIDKHWLSIYRTAITEKNLELLFFARKGLSDYKNKFTSERQFVIHLLLVDEEWESIAELLLFCFKENEYDRFDLFRIVRDCEISHLSNLLDLFNKLSAGGYEVNEVSLSPLLNRLFRASRFEEILSSIEKFANATSRHNPLVRLWESVALAHLGQDNESQLILKELMTTENKFLLNKYAPKIVEKMPSNDFRLIGEALTFEFVQTPPRESRIQQAPSISSFQRNRNLPKQIKKLYGETCQICQVPLNTPLGRISEAAHVQGLGHPHYGSDELANLLCLCPNHHALFDSSGIYISDQLEVYEALDGKLIGNLFVVESHDLSHESVRYHRNYTLNSMHRSKRTW